MQCMYSVQDAPQSTDRRCLDRLPHLTTCCWWLLWLAGLWARLDHTLAPRRRLILADWLAFCLEERLPERQKKKKSPGPGTRQSRDLAPVYPRPEIPIPPRRRRLPRPGKKKAGWLGSCRAFISIFFPLPDRLPWPPPSVPCHATLTHTARSPLPPACWLCLTSGVLCWLLLGSNFSLPTDNAVIHSCCLQPAAAVLSHPPSLPPIYHPVVLVVAVLSSAFLVVSAPQPQPQERPHR